MTIEKVSVEDAKKLLEIYGPYVSETAISFEYDVPSEDEFKNRIMQISAKYPYIKAVEDDEILGYAYAASFKGRKAYDWAVETTIYVKKDCKRKGVGTFLYKELEKSLKKMGILNMNACIASPVEEDERLTNDSFYFHKKMGFELVGRFHKCGYKFDTWYDMIWMEKEIGEHITEPMPVRFGQWTIETDV